MVISTSVSTDSETTPELLPVESPHCLPPGDYLSEELSPHAQHGLSNRNFKMYFPVS